MEEYLLEHLKEETPYHAPVKKTEPPTNGIFAMDAQRHSNFANEYYYVRCTCIKCANKTADMKPGYCLNCSCNKCKDLASKSRARRAKPAHKFNRGNIRLNALHTAPTTQVDDSQVNSFSEDEEYPPVEAPDIPFPDAEGLYQNDGYNKADPAVVSLQALNTQLSSS